MADWYVSSVAYAAIPAWAAITAYTVGQIIRPTAAAVSALYPFRCTTAGTTAASEPGTWNATNNGTTTSGTAVFTNVGGQSAYGWGAAAGALRSIDQNRTLAGDRIFLSSDHSESGSITSWTPGGTTHAFVLTRVISVNRAGSVPPTASDIQNGAALNATAGVALDAFSNLFWQGITFSAGNNFGFNPSGSKAQYFKNCIISLLAGSFIRAGGSGKIVFDNTVLQFANSSQSISVQAGSFELLWINTPSAIAGTVPAVLFTNPAAGGLFVTCRGVDLNAITGTLFNTASVSDISKILLDSCKIAPNVIRYTMSSTTAAVAHDEIELVNCFNGTDIINERHTAAGSVTTDVSTYMSSGAQDDVGFYSHGLASSSRSDICTMPLDSFWLDVQNDAIGASRTATVEIVSPTSLNDNDIKLLIEYMGVVPPPTSFDGVTNLVALSNGNLTVTHNNTTSNAGAISTTFLYAGKYYFEVVVQNTTTSLNGSGVMSSAFAGAFSTVAMTSLATCVMFGVSSNIYSNGVDTGLNLGTTAVGDVFCFAIDLTARLAWIRRNSGNWNANASADPATGTGGVTIAPSLSFAPIVRFTSSVATTDAMTANFGASAFAFSAPSGFGNWAYPSTYSVADFTESLSSVLASASALPSSSVTWTAPIGSMWNQYDAFANMLVTDNGLTATSMTAAGGPAYIRVLHGYDSGKYYFECTMVAWTGVPTAIGLTNSTSTTTADGPGGVGVNKNGSISVNNVSSGFNLGTRSSGDIIGIAVDFDANLIWFRVAPSGNWNGNATHNPATGAGGVNFAVVATVPLFPYFTPWATLGESATLNAGDSAFSGAVPSGFTAGWPRTLTKQQLQVTFTPQVAGRVRGRVQLGKVLTHVWVNPQVRIT